MKVNFLMGILLVTCTVAMAQEQPNSAEYHARHNPLSPNYVGSNQQSNTPRVRWEDRWGAIAEDEVNPIVGVVADAASKRKAQRAAVEDCRDRGGASCKVVLTYNNQCAAIVTGPKGTGYSHAETVEKAIDIGMQSCEKSDDKNCRVYYSGCSLPVQVN